MSLFMIEYPSITGCPIDKDRVNWLQYCDSGRFIPLLYVSLTGGLCNRILGLASCCSKATTESRLVKTYWPLNGKDGCSSEWSDVFTTPIQSFSEWDLYWIMDIMHEVRWYHRPEEAYVSRDSTNIVVVKSTYDYFAPDRIPIASEFSLDLNRQWCYALQLKPDIIENVQKFRLPPGTLGLHLRVSDDHQFSEGSFSKNALTVEMMDKVSQWPGKVLVVSNSLEQKLSMKAHFGSKILLQDIDSYERDSSGAKSAIVDVVLLSMCQERVGNWTSTLYRLAHFWVGRPDFLRLLG